MRGGEFVVGTDTGDVRLVFYDGEGDIHEWLVTPKAAKDLAAQLLVKAFQLEPE